MRNTPPIASELLSDRERRKKGCFVQFVILSRPRSGSNMLISILNQYRDIHCYGELFHPRKVQIGIDPEVGEIAENCPTLLLERENNTAGFLRNIVRNSGRTIFGFKHIIEHNAPITECLLRNPSIKIVLLRRKDSIAEYKSRERAERTGEWFVIKDTLGKATPDPCIDDAIYLSGRGFLDFLTRKARESKEIHAQLSAAARDGRILCVFYEDIQSDPAQLSKIVAFLGSQYNGPHIPQARTSVQRLKAGKFRKGRSYVLYEAGYRLVGDRILWFADMQRVLKRVTLGLIGK